MKKLIDKKNDMITIGEPLVEHIKLGNLKNEIRNELYGHLISPIFYSLVDKSVEKIEKSDYSTMYQSFSHKFSLEVNQLSDNLFKKYLLLLSKNMILWSEIFKKIDK